MRIIGAKVIMRRGISIIVFAAMLLTTGCGGPEKVVLGSWSGQYDLDNERIQSEIQLLNAQDRAQAETQLRAMQFTLDLKKDNTYVLTIDMLNTSGAVTGSWYINDDSTIVTLKPPQLDQEMRDQARDAGILSAMLVGQDLFVSEDTGTLAGSTNGGGFLNGIKFNRNE